MKPVYFSLGWFFFGLGALGVLLPVLPTTPFMILALWAFSKSSDRFHDWLYSHKVFGPPLQLWDRYRVIPTVAKVFSVAVMLISFLYLTLFTDTNAWILTVVAGLMLYGAVYILSKPSRPPEYSKIP